MAAFFACVAILVLFILLLDTRSRLKRAESTLKEAAKRIGALQRHAGLLPPRDGETPDQARAAASAPLAADRPAVSQAAPMTPPPSPWVTPSPEALDRWKPKAGEPAPTGQDPAPVEPAPTPAAPPPVTANAARPTDKALAPPVDMTRRFENLFGRTLPIWAGGVTLAIAGVLIVRYAIDAGFFARVFTPGVQVVTGLLFGLGLIGAAEYAWRNEDKVRDLRVPQALSGAGIATLYAAILVAANVYGLIGPLVAFIGLAVVTAAALGLSLRFGPPSALLALAGGLAAPALVGAMQPNVPLLAVYLGLTIAGLAGISRMKRWPWLALAALVGGVGWSLWMVLATNALDTLGSLSIGGYVLLLTLALPMLAFDGARAALLRAGSAIVGALQLALLVGIGGFALLHWGLFILIAAAGQWLAWRDKDFAIVPSVGLALSIVLLAVWPDPAAFWFAIVALALAAIHALPRLARLWSVGRSPRLTLELCALALAAPPLVKWHFWDGGDTLVALTALAASLVPGAAILLGWRAERQGDGRFAGLTAVTALLVALGAALLLPSWATPLAIGAVAAATMFFGTIANDRRIEPVAAGFVALALLALAAPPLALVELPRLFVGADAGFAARALFRWAGLTALLALFAARLDHRYLRIAALLLWAAVGYGTAAQIVDGHWLMLVPAVSGAAALLAARRVEPGRVAMAAIGFGAISLAWAAMPIAAWATEALLSLAGQPMRLETAALGIDQLLLRLLIPAALFAGPLWLIRERIPRWLLLASLGVAGLLGIVALHGFYRLGFAALIGRDFAATGVTQRLVWGTLLAGGAWIAATRQWLTLARVLAIAATAHAVWYGLTLHNPLWTAQSVGAWPVANLLVPLFALPWLGLKLVQRLFPGASAPLDRLVQSMTMLLVAGFAWATLRQIFHGALLVEPGVTNSENILRSILILALAIGFLLWGIRRHRRDWRIASLVLMLGAAGKVFLFDASGLEGLLRIGSFVVLGFSLIGIGWLYSRQLARPSMPPESLKQER